MSVALVATLLGACDLLPSIDDPSTPRLTHSLTNTGAQFSIDPWPYATAKAFLCLRDPGEAFHGSDPQVPPAAGCVPLRVALAGNRLDARFEVADVPADLLPDIQASGAPWFLAVAGSRGSQAETLVMSLMDSPVPSDPGPS